MKTISMPVYCRPDYLSIVLSSLRAQPEVKNYTLVFSLDNADCGSSNCVWVRDIIDAIDWAQKFIVKQPVLRGIRLNTWLAISTAFGFGSDFNVYLEDDYVLSPDVLALADSFNNRRLHWSSMLAFRRADPHPDKPKVVSNVDHGDGLLGAGFACGPNLRFFLEQHWFHDEEGGPKGWDISVGLAIWKHKIETWRPMVNRTQHIGEMGTNTRPNTFDNPALNSPCYKGRETEFIYG